MEVALVIYDPPSPDLPPKSSVFPVPPPILPCVSKEVSADSAPCLSYVTDADPEDMVETSGASLSQDRQPGETDNGAIPHAQSTHRNEINGKNRVRRPENRARLRNRKEERFRRIARMEAARLRQIQGASTEVPRIILPSLFRTGVRVEGTRFLALPIDPRPPLFTIEEKVQTELANLKWPITGLCFGSMLGEGLRRDAADRVVVEAATPELPSKALMLEKMLLQFACKDTSEDSVDAFNTYASLLLSQKIEKRHRMNAALVGHGDLTTERNKWSPEWMLREMGTLLGIPASHVNAIVRSIEAYPLTGEVPDVVLNRCKMLAASAMNWHTFQEKVFLPDTPVCVSASTSTCISTAGKQSEGNEGLIAQPPQPPAATPNILSSSPSSRHLVTKSSAGTIISQRFVDFVREPSSTLHLSLAKNDSVDERSRGRHWSQSEDSALIKAMEKFGRSWDTLATLFPQRSKQQVQSRGSYLIHHGAVTLP